MIRVIWMSAITTLIFNPASGATVQPTAGISILSASFGTLGRKRKLDIAARLDDLCGRRSQSCDVFCSETSFGRYNLGSHPICRVVYRCPDGHTRSAEAAREEPIMLRCQQIALDEAPTPPAITPVQ
jgi:hypothetical protein